jgi:hypothetical protein
MRIKANPADAVNSKIWRCPECHANLIVLEFEGGPLRFQWQGRVCRACPHCHRSIKKAWRRMRAAEARSVARLPEEDSP